MIGLIVSLYQEFQGEGIVLVFFEIADGFVELLLIHEQSAGGSVVGTLDDAVAAAGGHLFELLETVIGQVLIAGMRGAHSAIAQNAGEFFILIALGNGVAMAQRLLCLLQIL